MDAVDLAFISGMANHGSHELHARSRIVEQTGRGRCNYRPYSGDNRRTKSKLGNRLGICHKFAILFTSRRAAQHQRLSRR
jgi:hypothetical protein